jgi:hypothetical protein
MKMMMRKSLRGKKKNYLLSRIFFPPLFFFLVDENMIETISFGNGFLLFFSSFVCYNTNLQVCVPTQRK